MIDTTYPSYLFLLVCYYNEDEISHFLRNQLAKQSCGDYCVIIADNGSRNKSILNDLANDDPRIRVASCPLNLGYLGGAAFALADYPGNILPGLVILCNTDILFSSADFLKKLLEKSKTNPFHILGPDVYSERFRLHQNPYIPRRIPRRKMKSLKIFTSSYCLYNLFLLIYYFLNLLLPGRKNHIAPDTHGPRQVYSVHGSFIVFSETFFECGGNLNYDSFLFGEEIFIGELAREKEMKVIYDPDFQIIHREHSTTGLFKSKTAVKYLNQSYNYLLHKYY